MKKVLSIVAVALMVALVFTSCKKQKTMTELLTIEKGWVMSAATTTPYWTLNDNSQITNLFEGYVYDCEKDDIIKFKEDGHVYLNPGANVCEGEASQESSIGTWKLYESEKRLDMQIPFFYDTEVENVAIVELTEEMLKVNYTWTLTEDDAKGVPGTYTFTITYVPSKK